MWIPMRTLESSARGEGEFRLVLLVASHLAMRAAGVTGLRASPERLVDDGLDRARTAAAFGAAAEAAINLLGVAQHVVGGADGMADIVVREDVAGA